MCHQSKFVIIKHQYVMWHGVVSPDVYCQVNPIEDLSGIYHLNPVMFV